MASQADSLAESMVTIQNSERLDVDLIDLDESDAQTPAEVLAEMRVAWQNEVAAPALLPHRGDLLECLIDQVNGMQENVDAAKDKTLISIAIHRMEIHRLNYLLNDYMRIRLQKIEKSARFALDEHRRRNEQQLPELLTPQEVKFASRYASAEGKLMGMNFLGRLPPTFRKIPALSFDYEYDRVYAKVTADGVEDVTVPDYTDGTAELVVSLEKDSVHLISFKSVRDHVENGVVRLL